MRRLLVLLAGVVVLGVAGVYVVTAWFVGLPLNTTTFDATAWRTASRNEPVRAAMLGDFFARHDLVGMDRTAVESLLGPPDSRRWSERSPYPGYYTGSRLAGTDRDGLLISYDERGRVVGYTSEYGSGGSIR